MLYIIIPLLVVLVTICLIALLRGSSIEQIPFSDDPRPAQLIGESHERI